MIKIVIKKPTKLSGLQSVYISTPYNAEVIEIIKQYPPAI